MGTGNTHYFPMYKLKCSVKSGFNKCAGLSGWRETCVTHSRSTLIELTAADRRSHTRTSEGEAWRGQTLLPINSNDPTYSLY